ncbi:MAG TPA: alkaline phosphatase family protein [Solirubrobacteraceae bacterium]
MSDHAERSSAITRRRALRDLGLAGLGATTLSGLQGLLDQAAAASPHTGSLKNIDHVVIFIQENRSFDHYFGTLSGVRGFGDKKAHKTFFQPDLAGEKLHPYHLSTGCLPDITHDWGPQHQSWNGGRMNGFITSREPASVNGPVVAPETMGYHTRSDLQFYYALADAFTICDGYYCSVIGPTDPNRLMSMSGSIDPAGAHGGPLLSTLSGAQRSAKAQTFTWPTMPESLDARGVSWKVYTDPAAGSLDNVLTYFKPYAPGSKLYNRAVVPTYPHDFMSDIADGKLPQVSWVLAGGLLTEHPAFSTPLAGEIVARQIVEALVSHPKIWRKTALFITWDENGGFFDHVAPPTPPPGTAGEYLTVATLPSDAQGIRGPIGLGFRVPMLVVSPFSRGGLVCSDTCDHTSTLRFLETRFGAKVPNLSRWRHKHTGDLTSAFNFAAKPRYGRLRLPGLPPAAANCILPPPAPVTQGPFPRQEHGKRRRPSGPVH